MGGGSREGSRRGDGRQPKLDGGLRRRAAEGHGHLGKEGGERAREGRDARQSEGKLGT